MKALEELAQLFETMTATAASETQAAVFQWCLDATREKIAAMAKPRSLASGRSLDEIMEDGA